MAEQLLRRIELIFQTEVKILKYPYPGLSYFSLRTARPLMENCTRSPNCLAGLDAPDSLRICRLPLTGNNNLRMVYLSVLILAFEDTQTRLLRRVKNLAYDESQPLTYFPRESIPEEFRQHYQDRLFRKLLVEFFHLVGSKRSPNRVIKFIELHPILDLCFVLLFKRLLVEVNPSAGTFSEKLNTGDIIAVIFNKLELTPSIADRRLRLSQYRYLAEDEDCTYMTYHWKDDVDMDFPQTLTESDSDDESPLTTNGSVTKFSLKDSNCDSTKVEQVKRWVTPNKVTSPQVLFQSTVVSRDTRDFNLKDRLPPLPKSPVETSKPKFCMDEVEMKCGEIKTRIRKLETEVETYNNNSVQRGRGDGIIQRVFQPLMFKDTRQVIERKQSTEFETSFFKEKPIERVEYKTNGTPNSASSSLSKLIACRPSQYTTPQIIRTTQGDFSQNRSVVSLKTESPALVRTNSNIQRLSSSSSRKIGAGQSETKISSSSSLLLKENPKKIFVRKI